MRFFAKEKMKDEETKEAFKKMAEQIEAVGGQLTFKMKTDEEGWIARCKEFPGIVTGGKNKNPSKKKIMESLIEATKTAFHVPIEKLDIKKEEKSLPRIKLINEFQFQLA